MPREGSHCQDKNSVKRRALAVRKAPKARRALQRSHRFDGRTNSGGCADGSSGDRALEQQACESANLADPIHQSAIPHSSAAETTESAERPPAFDNEDTTRLPSGCVIGSPIAQGTPVEYVPGGRSALDSAVMGSIQSNNYRFLSYMIGCGWSYSLPHAHTFYATINRLGPGRNVMEEWTITSATPLHYAITCFSINAAAALLIAFPELVSEVCTVDIASEHGIRRCQWTPLQLAAEFAKLYANCDEPRHHAYRITAIIMQRLIFSPASVPFVHHGSSRTRMAAAGSDVHAVLAALCAAAECDAHVDDIQLLDSTP